jgi:hypothetical protein
MRFKFIDWNRVEYVQLRITPDRTADNTKVHDMIRALSSFYAAPIDVIRGKKVGGAFWWDVMMSADAIRFYCTVPADWRREITKHVENTWPSCAVEIVPEFETLMPAESDVCEMKNRRANLFALKIDRRTEIEPLSSILSVTSEMEPLDVARLSICAAPISRIDWQDTVERQYRTFKAGDTPRRTRLNKRDIFISAGEMVTGFLQSALDTVYLALGDEAKKTKKADDIDKRLIMIDGNLSRGTLNKLKAPTFNTHIRIVSHSSDAGRQRVILRSIANSFNDLTADNELEREDIHEKLKPVIVRELNTYRISWPTRLDFDKNVMSNEELGRLVELPTAALQDAQSDRMETLDSRQVKVPELLTKGGIRFGDVAYKKADIPVYIPLKSVDRLCLPSVFIGGMGSGKTTAGTVRAIEFVRNGYSSLLVDPAKSEMWTLVKASLPPDKRRRILLGQDVISLDFREALRSPSGRGRLAQIILAFFEDNTDTAGAQTQRFLRAAVMGMKTGKLREIIRILTDMEYRVEVIADLPEGMHRDSLTEFGAYSADRQRQIMAPIMNRLDVILGDPYLERCMNADVGIDMTEILSKRGMCTVIDVPDRLNTRAAKDILINLVSFKIDAAMALRSDEFPFAVLYDEPHQYLRSAKLWENVAVESRKYRLSYHWLFHSFEQIPDKLAQIIKDAGPHYFVLQSSKQTYRSLAEELAPFKVEEGLNTKQHHAICALKFGDGRMTPFMVRMMAP